MDDKLQLLTESLPKAMLQALTPEAKEAVPGHLLRGDMVVIYTFPFSIGRESRVTKINGRLETLERPKKDDIPPTNDLYLLDRGHRLNISREHCTIVKGDRGYLLIDRGSACGTKVKGNNIGGDDRGGEVQLYDGDEIGVGTVDTPYVFRFIAFDDYCVIKKEE